MHWICRVFGQVAHRQGASFEPVLALYLLLAVAGLTIAVPATLQVIDGVARPRFSPVTGAAFFALTAGVAGIIAEQFDVRLVLSLLAVIPLGIAGGLLHFEWFQTLARRNGHPTAETPITPSAPSAPIDDAVPLPDL